MSLIFLRLREVRGLAKAPQLSQWGLDSILIVASFKAHEALPTVPGLSSYCFGRVDSKPTNAKRRTKFFIYSKREEIRT